MIKGYPLYKESESTHIGKIPKHWDTFKLGRLGRFSSSGIDKKTKEREQIVNMVNYMDVYNNKSHIIDSQRKLMRVGCPDQKIAEHSLLSGDMLFTPSSETKEDIGWSAVVTENLKRTVYSYHLIRLRFVHPMDLNFKKYMCNNFNVMNQFTESCNGTTRQILSRGDFRNTVVAIPPLTEQIQIARYLDYKNYQINKYIRIKKRQIELLKELKQTIINDAVTGKIDVRTGKPYPKYKDSGIDWLGMMPEDWELSRIGKLVRFNPSKSEVTKQVTDTTLCTFIPMEKLSVTGTVDCSVKLPMQQVKSGFTYFRRNDIVLAKITPCFENGKSACLDSLDSEFGFGTTEFIVLRITGNINGKYLWHIISSPTFLKFGKKSMRGAAGQQRVPIDFVSEYPIALPSLLDQEKILTYLSRMLMSIDDMIAILSSQSHYAKELQTRLISDVVTGKLDVRDVDVPEIPEDELEQEFEVDEDLIEESENADRHQ